MLRRAGTVLALLLAVAALRTVWVKYRGSDATDFWLFWAVAQSDLRDPYAPRAGRALRAASEGPEATPGQRLAAIRSSLAITGTPFLYSVFRTVGTGDYELDYALFRLLSLAATCAGILLLAISADFPLWAALLMLAATVGLFPSMTSDLQVGNVNQLQLGGLGALVALLRAPVRRFTAAASGALGAALVLFKPNLIPIELLLLAGWAGRQRFDFVARHLVGAVVAGIAAIAASSAVFSNPAVWLSWLSAAARLSRNPALPLAYGNLSLAHAIGVPPVAGTLLGVLLVAVTAALQVRSQRDDPFFACAAGVAIPLLTATLAWQHYFLLLVPGLIGCARRAPWLALVAAAPLYIGWSLSGWKGPVFVAEAALACCVLLGWTWSELAHGTSFSVPRTVAAPS